MFRFLLAVALAVGSTGCSALNTYKAGVAQLPQGPMTSVACDPNHQANVGDGSTPPLEFKDVNGAVQRLNGCPERVFLHRGGERTLALARPELLTLGENVLAVSGAAPYDVPLQAGDELEFRMMCTDDCDRTDDDNTAVVLISAGALVLIALFLVVSSD